MGDEGFSYCAICGELAGLAAGGKLCNGCWQVDRNINDFVTSPRGLERVLAALGKARGEVDNASAKLQSAALLYIHDRLHDSVEASDPRNFDATSNPYACSYGYMGGRVEDVARLAYAVARHAGAPISTAARNELLAAIDALSLPPRVMRTEADHG